MKASEIYSALNAVAPTAYLAFPEESGQEPPFIVYHFPGIDDLYADNRNYQRISDLTVELYTDNKDMDTESEVEAALDALGIAYDKEETYIQSERLYEVIYSTQIILED